ncbi:MAG: cytochrome c peroxidase [bacterium]
MKFFGALLLSTLAVAALGQGDLPGPEFSARDLQRIASLSPLGPVPGDETNRFALDPRAALLGQRLFFEPGLSANGKTACATCHDPEQSFGDGLPRAVALAEGPRRTPSLWNLAYARWYFYDGRADSLWAQALQPMENEIEMGSDRLAILRAVQSRPLLRSEFEALRGALPELSDSERFPEHARPRPDAPGSAEAVAWLAMAPEDREAVNRAFADLGKMLAAYERLLVSRDSAFDRFAEGLREDDAEKKAALSVDAQRGLKLFLGKGRCRLCHNGPNFSDGEFHGLGLAPPGGGMPTDAGRYNGLPALLADPFNARGAYSDAPAGVRARILKGLRRSTSNWGEFKTPSLREVSRRGPFMHAGQFATLEVVLEFYSTLEGAAALHQHQEQILAPRNFSAGERADLLAFLESLEGAPLPATLLKAP